MRPFRLDMRGKPSSISVQMAPGDTTVGRTPKWLRRAIQIFDPVNRLPYELSNRFFGSVFSPQLNSLRSIEVDIR